MLVIRPAAAEEAAVLTPLLWTSSGARRRRGGMERPSSTRRPAAGELGITAEHVQSDAFFVAVLDGDIRGFVRVGDAHAWSDDTGAEVIHLFVDPAAMARGLGRRLWGQRRRGRRARASGAVGDLGPPCRGLLRAAWGPCTCGTCPGRSSLAGRCRGCARTCRRQPCPGTPHARAHHRREPPGWRYREPNRMTAPGAAGHGSLHLPRLSDRIGQPAAPAEHDRDPAGRDVLLCRQVPVGGDQHVSHDQHGSAGPCPTKQLAVAEAANPACWTVVTS